MKTILRAKSTEVSINTDGLVRTIGEKINPTGRKKLSRMLTERNMDYVLEIATKQIDAGADILDINVGVPGEDEVELLPAVVTLVAEHFDIPLCLDSANPKALAAGLAVAPGRPLVNSVNGEEKSLENILPLVKEYQVAVIGLTMDDDGIPKTAEKRVAIAGKILERAVKIGLSEEDVVIDPLVLTVGADHNAATVTLEAIASIRKEFGVNINLGASNVSFGLPDRHTINQAFLALAIQAGANCMITDPAKLNGIIKAADLLLGKDDFGRAYITHYRATQKK
ncbi:MAG: dihydropteroate synthase [Anaerolineae bacterium]|jgi:5-methyltetrahydrofolate--homocysteine methyltransferase|nr:dihydropteroate synthase [Anaerolineae bacterium]MBT4310121.1 dihydropteroate synthase [Anaerolineae bacterium]MBT4457941.1 dihydropteroate synthase [Anaerolineae bacterium]MBT4841383.1 dihydropteroate synthase [Anaerolineae bacterium]MBT6062487.1 dihydropteroate synthase [Anaerolineae bacterium]